MLYWLAVPLLLQAQAIVDNAAPSAAEQDRILASMHAYANRYVENLPNFLCLQTTRQLEAPVKAKRWRNGDALVYQLSFNQGEERRALQSVNGKPLAVAPKHWRTPLHTEGEFGILLSRVLGKDSDADYAWSGWATIAGKRMAVFTFDVEKAHSTLVLQLNESVQAAVPYHGAIHADPETGAVWRIADIATDIPAVLQTRELGTTVDYAVTAIGDRSYLLPAQAVVSLLLDSRKIRNEITFTEYRKFTADSSITFESGEAKP